MSEKSQEILLKMLDEDPDYDGDLETIETQHNLAFYESSKIDIQDNMNTEDFEATWKVQRSNIENQTIDLQRIFSEQTLDKIDEIYDFRFPETITLDTMYENQKFYEFLEFLEYKNEDFIAHVWRFLKPVNLMRFDITGFCTSNADKVIREIEEQLEIHPQDKLIDLFLRTYYKEKLIEWFINRTERYKINITVKIFEKGA